MKKLMLLFLLCFVIDQTFAQKQTFDLTTFTVPKGWDKKEGKDAIQLSKHDEKSDSYCLITLYKSTLGTADAKENFEMAWTTLVKETITVSTAPEMQPAATENGWEMQSGHAPYESESTKGVAMLITASCAEKMVNMIILTNTAVYEKEMTAFIESMSLKKLETLPVVHPEDTQQSTDTSKETFDLITYTPPKGWTKNIEETLVSYTITDSKTNSWCRMMVIKSTISKGSIEADFESEWQTLVVKNYQTTGQLKENETQEADGWKIKAGTGKFTFDKSECSAMLTTASGYDRCVSIVAVANNRNYINQIQAFIESIDLIKPELATPPAVIANTDENSIIGTWVRSASNQSNDAVNNGISGNIKNQYTFNADGTYTFYTKTFQYTFNKLLLTRESGTYKIEGENITINPKKSVIEAWSKGTVIESDGRKSETDKWGKFLSSQNRKLEKVTYTFTKHYFAGIQEWNLVLQADRTTERDGPFSSNTTFNNAWYYAEGKYPIELPK